MTRRSGFGSYMVAPGLTRIDAVCDILRAIDAGAVGKREAIRALVEMGGVDLRQAVALQRWAFEQWISRVYGEDGEGVEAAGALL